MHLTILTVFKIDVWLWLKLLILYFAFFDSSSFCQNQRGALIFQEEFNKNQLNVTLWEHLWITRWRESSQFQFYQNSRKNRLDNLIAAELKYTHLF